MTETASEKRIDCVLLTGFLGAGKTSLLADLLSHPLFAAEKKAALVNEFSRLGVDTALLPKGDWSVAEVDSGSIFCVCVKTDLIAALETIAEAPDIDILFIEATGMAEPTDFSSLFQTGALRARYRPAATIAVADAVNFLKLEPILPALGKQVALADIILLNKVDLAGPALLDETERRLRSLNPRAALHRTLRCDFPAEELIPALGGGSSGGSGGGALPGGLRLCTEAPTGTVSCELRSLRAVGRVAFYEFLERNSAFILRGKGLVDFGGDRRFVEIVNGDVSARPAGDIVLEPFCRVAMSLILRGKRPADFEGEFRKLPSASAAAGDGGAPGDGVL